MAVVFWRYAGSGKKTKRKWKTLTATTQEHFLGQGAVRAVWILSAMKPEERQPQRPQPLALEGVSGLKERSSGLHQLSPGRRLRADIMLLVTYIQSHTHMFIHTLYSVKLQRLKPRGEERVRSRASSGGVLSLIFRSLPIQSYVSVSAYMYEDV